MLSNPSVELVHYGLGRTRRAVGLFGRAEKLVAVLAPERGVVVGVGRVAVIVPV